MQRDHQTAWGQDPRRTAAEQETGTQKRKNQQK